jgi:hypothetical protein
MPSLEIGPSVSDVSGFVHQVDVPGRQLWVSVRNQVMRFDVAPECTVVLHGERVKLRLLQPMDYAYILYACVQDSLVAYSVLVH